MYSNCLIVSGTIQPLDLRAICVSCSPAALRETSPVPPVTLLRSPAVNKFKLQQPPPLPPLRLPQLQLKVKSREIVVFMSFLTFNINGMFESEREDKILTRSQLHLVPVVTDDFKILNK